MQQEKNDNTVAGNS